LLNRIHCVPSPDTYFRRRILLYIEQLKTLRKQVLSEASTIHDFESDKVAKKQFKKNILELEEDSSGKKRISLAEDGIVKLLSSSKEKKEKKKKKQDDKVNVKEKKKRKRLDLEDDGDAQETRRNKEDDEYMKETAVDANKDSHNAHAINNNFHENKNDPCEGNPMGHTRLFIGNLPFAVDDASLSTHLAPAEMTHIKWISDKETGRFYGSAFVEMKTSQDAAIAVTKFNGSQLMGRAIKINYAPARPGDIWPPTSKVVTGGQAGTAKGVTSMSEKPDGCRKLFVGNLSFDIDDDTIYNFFASVGAEIKAVRWLSHHDSGDFKGCGFVEFWTSEACDKGATLNGKKLLGRPIRIDWTE
jgi:nucleolin